MRFDNASYRRMAATLHDTDLLIAWEETTRVMDQWSDHAEIEAYAGLQDWRGALEREWNGRTELRSFFPKRA